MSHLRMICGGERSSVVDFSESAAGGSMAGPRHVITPAVNATSALGGDLLGATAQQAAPTSVTIGSYRKGYTGLALLVGGVGLVAFVGVAVLIALGTAGTGESEAGAAAAAAEVEPPVSAAPVTSATAPASAKAPPPDEGVVELEDLPQELEEEAPEAAPAPAPAPKRAAATKRPPARPKPPAAKQPPAAASPPPPKPPTAVDLGL
jgi:hypothetical protein